MALDIDKVEAILRQHWQIPSDLSRVKLQEQAGRIKFWSGKSTPMTI